MINMPNIGGITGPRNREGTMLRAVTETIRVLHSQENPGDYFLTVAGLYHRREKDATVLSGKPLKWFNNFEVVTESVIEYARHMYWEDKEHLKSPLQLVQKDWAKLIKFHQFLQGCCW